MLMHILHVVPIESWGGWGAPLSGGRGAFRTPSLSHHPDPPTGLHFSLPRQVPAFAQPQLPEIHARTYPEAVATGTTYCTEMAFRFGSHESEDSSELRADRRHQRAFDEDDAPANKRQRTALACNSCRYRKSRCNGAHPTCSTCSDLGFECVYRGPAPAPRFAPHDMQSVEKRLQKFEDVLMGIAKNQQMANDTGNLLRYTAQQQASNYVGAPALEDPSALASSNLLYLQMEQASAQRDRSTTKLWPMAQEDTVDGMGSIIFADESSSGFFGPSSNSAFFGNIARVLSLSVRTMPDGREPTRDLAGTLSRPPSPPAQNRGASRPVNLYKLPSRAEISRLIDIFFSFTGHFFPYVSKTSLTEMVEELEMTRFSSVRKSGLCLLNAVFAMGTSLDGETGRDRKSRETEADVFFQRALALSPWSISNTANMETCKHGNLPHARCPPKN